MRQLILLLLLCLPLSAAFHAATEWDVRTTGADTNGGGFQAGAIGTDYSQQDAPQTAYTDIVIGGTTTQFTSAANPVTDAIVGNVINIVSGAGCTVQRVQVVSQSGGTATVDKALGSAASTCTGNMGGALATVGVAASLAVNYNRVYIRAGTYALTSTASLAMGAGTLIGYQTAHNDMGTRPLITTSTDSTVLITTSGSSGGLVQFVNLSLSNTATVRADGVQVTRGDTRGIFYRSLFDGFNIGISRNGGGTWVPLIIVETEVKNSTSIGVYNRDEVIMIDSYIHNNGGHGIQFSGGTWGVGTWLFSGNIFANNGGDGIYLDVSNATEQSFLIHRCAFVGNAGDGIQTGAGGGGLTGAAVVDIISNIFFNNGAYGVNNPVVPLNISLNRSNAYGSNGTAPVLNMPSGQGDVTLTADPFTNAAAGDYSLNNAAGGGALLKQAGFPGVFPGGTTTGYLDIGAVQSQGGAAAVTHGAAWAN